MTAAHGDSYACFVPVPGVSRAAKSERSAASLRLARLAALLTHEDRPCVGRRFDHWTYEVCAGRSVRQLRTDGAGGTVSIEFSLGEHAAERAVVDTQVGQ